MYRFYVFMCFTRDILYSSERVFSTLTEYSRTFEFSRIVAVYIRIYVGLPLVKVMLSVSAKCDFLKMVSLCRDGATV